MTMFEVAVTFIVEKGLFLIINKNVLVGLLSVTVALLIIAI